MKRILLSGFIFLRKNWRKARWRFEAWKERGKLDVKESVQIPLKGKKLILIPHVDDEWMGCSRIVAAHADEVLLCNMDMPGGDSVQMHEVRRKELHLLAHKYGRELLTISNSKSQALEGIIRDVSPDYIFVPFNVDWHGEHEEVIRILRNALINLKSEGKCHLPFIAAYQVSIPILPKFVTHCIAMNRSDWKEKWTTFYDIYITQRLISFDRFALNERVNGKISDSFAAEVFFVSKTEEWLNNVEDLSMSNEEKKLLKNSLLSISKMRNVLSRLRQYN